MDGSNHNDTGGRVNGLISPLLTPVTEEPPSLHQTTSSADFNGPRPDSDQVLIATAVTKNGDSSLSSHSFPLRSDIAIGVDANEDIKQEVVLKLSAAQITELTSELASLPELEPSALPEDISDATNGEATRLMPKIRDSDKANKSNGDESQPKGSVGSAGNSANRGKNPQMVITPDLEQLAAGLEAARLQSEQKGGGKEPKPSRPSNLPRSVSVPFPLLKQTTSVDRIKPKRLSSKLTGVNDATTKVPLSRTSSDVAPSLKSPPLPLPPLSIPTHLHLELSADRPSPLYIYRNQATSLPYESSKVKFERLLNFLLLPPQLEEVLLFGTLTCLDAWLYVFTILPLRFLKASWILLEWAVSCVITEILAVPVYIFRGVRWLWLRPNRKRRVPGETNAAATTNGNTAGDRPAPGSRKTSTIGSPSKKTTLKSRLRDRLDRKRQRPSPLQAGHKADILQGLIIIFSCIFLMKFDASRMYHAIRGQAAIKLYVIYNVLEVCDRLFSALGQDIMDCLFSSETLDRKPNGRSRIIRPIWMFLLALAYTVFHAMAFFYQVTTLNVAVNSYSNALLTLLMSNQFVEIKGTVFKKIEKDNLFQLTCADIVERFQLWLMLLVIAMRNIVELGGFSASTGDFAGPTNSGSSTSNTSSGVPFRTFGILPQSFTLLPSSFPAQVFGPFLIVLGSEMLVDWLKHAYISKFNAVAPAVYGRFLDVLAKDYYSNAFAEQNLTRRLGLPVIPLACLFIRASLQTYHMFLATTMSPPTVIATTTTSLSLETAAQTTATSFPILAQIDHIFRRALGRSSLGTGSMNSSSSLLKWTTTWTLDDLIALTTMLSFFLALYLLLLVFKLCLGMALLRFARDRYKSTNARETEKQSFVLSETKRLGGWGAVEVGDERRKVIYEGDAAGLKAMREREAKFKEGDLKLKADKLEVVERYAMVGKRIW